MANRIRLQSFQRGCVGRDAIPIHVNGSLNRDFRERLIVAVIGLAPKVIGVCVRASRCSVVLGTGSAHLSSQQRASFRR